MNEIIIDPKATPAASMFAATSPFDNPQSWERTQALESPLTEAQLAQVQSELDGIVGTTRDGKSIAKIVWNGDRKYWKELHDKWATDGTPIGDTYKRPIVLYKQHFNSAGAWTHDSFPPRFLVLTRIEPEQYADAWAEETKIQHPVYNVKVQLLPSECPPERHVWFMTIALHTAGCCQRAAKEDRDCYGRYVHPRACLEEFRRVRKSMEAAGTWESTPFDSPRELEVRREREFRGKNNYIENALRQYREGREQLQTDAELETLRKDIMAAAEKHGVDIAE